MLYTLRSCIVGLSLAVTGSVCGGHAALSLADRGVKPFSLYPPPAAVESLAFRIPCSADKKETRYRNALTHLSPVLNYHKAQVFFGIQRLSFASLHKFG